MDLSKKHLVTLASHVQQFTIGMLNLIGEEITEDELRAGQPRSALIAENIEAVRQLINVVPDTYQRIQDTL